MLFKSTNAGGLKNTVTKQLLWAITGRNNFCIRNYVAFHLFNQICSIFVITKNKEDILTKFPGLEPLWLKYNEIRKCCKNNHHTHSSSTKLDTSCHRVLYEEKFVYWKLYLVMKKKSDSS